MKKVVLNPPDESVGNHTINILFQLLIGEMVISAHAPWCSQTDTNRNSEFPGVSDELLKFLKFCERKHRLRALLWLNAVVPYAVRSQNIWQKPAELII